MSLRFDFPGKIWILWHNREYRNYICSMQSLLQIWNHQFEVWCILPLTGSKSTTYSQPICFIINKWDLSLYCYGPSAVNFSWQVPTKKENGQTVMVPLFQSQENISGKVIGLIWNLWASLCFNFFLFIESGIFQSHFSHWFKFSDLHRANSREKDWTQWY